MPESGDDLGISWRQLLDAAGDAILLVHETRGIQYANPQAEKLFGYTNAELAGQGVEMLIPEADRQRHRDLRAHYNRWPKPVPMGAVPKQVGCHKDGSRFRLEISLAPFEGPDGRLILATARDVTELRNLREAQASSVEASASAQSIVDAARCMADPLTYLQGNLDVLEERVAAQGRRASGRGDAHDALARDALADPLGHALEAAALLRQLHADLSVMAGHADPEGIRDSTAGTALSRALRLARPSIEQRVALQLEIEDLPLPVADEGRLTLLFTQLLLDAARAVEGSGHEEPSLTVHAEVDDRGGVTVSIEGIHGHALVSAGEAEAGHLGFEGCRAIAMALGGDLRATTDDGVARVVVTLPPPRSASRRGGATTGARQRILVVARDPRLRALVESTAPAHVHVDGAADGREVLTRMHRGERWHAIVCQVGLPRMGGIALHERLELDAPELAEAMVFVSGTHREPEVDSVVARSNALCLTKPFTAADLRRALQAKLDRGPTTAGRRRR